MWCVSMSYHNVKPHHQTIVVRKESRKRALQVILRQQKKVANSISLLSGYNTSESNYAWKTVKAIEKKINEVENELNDMVDSSLLFNLE